MKVFAALVLFLACLVPVHADTVNVSAISCHPDFFVNSCLGNVGAPNIDFEAVVTVELVTGRFLDPFQGLVIAGPEEEVLSMTGTLNGSPITLVQAPQGTASWFFPLGEGLGAGAVYFTAAGINGTILAFFDDARNLTGIPGEAPAQVDWTETVVNTPEPASLSLAFIGLCLIPIVRKVRTART